MNKVTLIGRLTKAPELKTTTNGTSVTNITLAVQKKKNRDEADFINVTVWGQTAINVAKYLTQGSQCAVDGSIQTRSYEGKNGRVYVTEVVADEVEFLGKPQTTNADDAFKDVLAEQDDTLPF